MGSGLQSVVVFVPAETALTYDGLRWQLVQAPPRWWLAEQEEQLARDEHPAGVLRLAPLQARQVTACRPGSGPCRRRHQHASPRRSAAA